MVICSLHTPSMEYDMYDMTRQGRAGQVKAGYYWVESSGPVAMREPFGWVREQR